MQPPADSPGRPPLVSREQWLIARQALLAEEKKLTHAADEVARLRRALPWVRVEREYVFGTVAGPRTLADLFDGRSQLCVYHFMLAPGQQEPCTGCSFIADHVDAARRHFEHADLSFAAVSRASVAEIEAVRKRLGWRFTWASSAGNSFNYDYGVSFTPGQLASGTASYNYGSYLNTDCTDLHGTSIFVKDESGSVYHTYSCYSRGNERLIGAFAFLDLTPKGRNETGGVMSWVRLGDAYDDGGSAPCCHGP